MKLFRRLMGKSSIDEENATTLIIGDEVPLLFKDCLNKAQKIKWLESENGQKILKQRPLLQKQYESGELFRLIDNPYWKVRLEQWLADHDENDAEHKGIVYGLSLPKTQEEKEKERGKNGWLHKPVEYNISLEDMFRQPYFEFQNETLSTEQKYELLTQGYTVLRNVIPVDLVNNAVTTIEEMVEERKKYVGNTKMENLESKGFEDPYFLSGVTNDPNVLALYYATPVYSIIESILHNPYGVNERTTLTTNSSEKVAKLCKTEFDPPVRPFRNAVGGGQVAYRFTHYSSLQKDKYGDQHIGGRSWHIDGLGRGAWGTFSLLVGIPLSTQYEEFSGNLCLHPGSHYTLQSYMKEYAQRYNEAETFDEKFSIVQKLPKIDLGEPTQVVCSAGDVVIALHKVAHLGGPNFSPQVRKMLYFRPAHRRHLEMRLDALENIWVEYEGMADVV